MMRGRSRENARPADFRRKARIQSVHGNIGMDDEDLVMISALQHFLFCKRQCALIHIEHKWAENRFTASGKTLHERVDAAKSETRKTLRQATALRLVSRRLGITGIADMVEFHLEDSPLNENGDVIAASISGIGGYWRPFPVEYKRGKPKSHRADEVQLCAQAICLEEMLSVRIPAGALFYGEPRRRTDVVFDEDLRLLTETTAKGLHDLVRSGVTPPPSCGKWCGSCSLAQECQPEIASSRSARAWIDKSIREISG